MALAKLLLFQAQLALTEDGFRALLHGDLHQIIRGLYLVRPCSPSYHPLMNTAEKPNVWWTYDHPPIRWAIVASLVIAWFLAVFLLYSDAMKVLAARPWWEDFIVALATVAVPILTALELRHSAEANRLRGEANDERRRANVHHAEANRLSQENARLTAALDAERNEQLAQIATNTARPISPAERNAEILRRHLGACVSVSEGTGSWPSTPLIVEVSDANILTLFTPSGGSNPQASFVQVDCGELDITDIPHGSCPFRLHLRRRYGSSVQLGEITRWEDRNLPAAAPRFNKGGNAHYMTFTKQGSSETRGLYIYVSADGSNSFLLEASTGERVVADNVEISKRFVLLAVDYLAAGFSRGNSGTGGSPHRLYTPTF